MTVSRFQAKIHHSKYMLQLIHDYVEMLQYRYKLILLTKQSQKHINLFYIDTGIVLNHNPTYW